MSISRNLNFRIWTLQLPVPVPMGSKAPRVGNQREKPTFTFINSGDPNARRKAISHTSSEHKRKCASAREVRLASRLRQRQTLVATPPIINDLRLARHPSPISILGAGRVDPFARYPVPSSRLNECHGLVDHCESLACDALDLRLIPNQSSPPPSAR